MSKSLLLMLCIVTGLLVLACAKTEETNRNAAATNSAAPASTPATSTNSSASADKIGIEECDSFLTAYETCITTKVPEAGRATYKPILANWRAEWKKLADNPQTRGTLAGICKTQMETARTQMKSIGCTF